MKKFVDIETPYMASSPEQLKRNIRYARACMRDCLLRGEMPFASHLLYTQSGILDDNVPEERKRGIMAGKAIIEELKATTVVYTDLGLSNGMKFGIEMAKKSGRSIEERTLGERWEEEFIKHQISHSHNSIW